MKVLLMGSDIYVKGILEASIHLRWPDGILLTDDSPVQGLEILEAEFPGLVVVHDQVKDMALAEVIHEIRLFSSVPVMVLGEEPDQMKIITALTTGADDYVRLPCAMSEMMARIWSLLRRAIPGPSRDGSPPVYSGDLLIDKAAHQVFLRGQPLRLTPAEFRLLHLLIRNYGVVVSQGTLEQELDASTEGARQLAKKYVQRLRKKLEDDPLDPSWIATVRGIGYRFIGPRPYSHSATG